MLRLCFKLQLQATHSTELMRKTVSHINLKAKPE